MEHRRQHNDIFKVLEGNLSIKNLRSSKTIFQNEGEMQVVPDKQN